MADKTSYNATARRRVLQSFVDRNKLKIQTWTKASGLSEAGVRSFLAGRAVSMSDRTYAMLAEGASKLLERKVEAAALRGDPPPNIEIKVLHYIGAGDEIHPIDDNEAFDYTIAPPGYEEGGAGIVRGDSMLPVFEEDDVLFWREIESPPRNPPKRAVVVHVADGPLFVKRIIPGSKKGFYHLLSVNPATSPIVEQRVEAIARIGWIRPAQ